MAAGLTKESLLIGTVSFSSVTAYETFTAGVSGVYQDNRHTGQGSFVLDLLGKIMEAPGMVDSALGLSNSYSGTDARQVFEGYSAPSVFGLVHQMFADDVISVLTEPVFFLATFLQKALGSRCPLGLQFASEVGISGPDVVYVRTGINLAIRINGNGFNAQVNANKLGYVIRDWFIHITGSEQIKLTIYQTKVGFAPLFFKQDLLPLATNKWQLKPTFEGQDRNSLQVDLPRKYPVVVTNSTKLFEGTLRFLVQFVGVADLGNSPDCHLSRQAKLASHVLIDDLLQAELAKGFSFPGLLADIVARLINGCQRILESLPFL